MSRIYSIAGEERSRPAVVINKPLENRLKRASRSLVDLCKTDIIIVSGGFGNGLIPANTIGFNANEQNPGLQIHRSKEDGWFKNILRDETANPNEVLELVEEKRTELQTPEATVLLVANIKVVNILASNLSDSLSDNSGAAILDTLYELSTTPSRTRP